MFGYASELRSCTEVCVLLRSVSGIKCSFSLQLFRLCSHLQYSVLFFSSTIGAENQKWRGRWWTPVTPDGPHCLIMGSARFRHSVCVLMRRIALFFPPETSNAEVNRALDISVKCCRITAGPVSSTGGASFNHHPV